MAGAELKHVLDGYKVLDFTQVLAGPEEARIPVAPVLSIEQAVNHPHLRHRRTVRTITDR
jgi:crotonobetainyl-CoA:carnitine CoA-transferase CaiB-like acyl-CoA transferase